MKKYLSLVLILVIVLVFGSNAYACEHAGPFIDCPDASHDIPATCTANAKECKICTFQFEDSTTCGAHNLVEVPNTMLNHNYELECDQGHSKPATCTEPGQICRVCNNGCGAHKIVDTIPAPGHSPKTEQKNIIPATYSAAGSYDEVTTCTVCTAELSKNTVIIPKLVVNSISIKGVTPVSVSGSIALIAEVDAPDAPDKPSVVWLSQNPGVATVDGNGIVTGVKSGETTITATCGDKTAVATVTVSASTPVVTNYTVSYNPGLYGSGSVSPTTSVGNAVTLSGNTFASLRPGYVQTGWSAESVGYTYFAPLGGNINIGADITLYPYWTPSYTSVYTVTFAPGTYGKGAPAAQSANIGSPVYLPDKGYVTSSRSGYVQTGWSYSKDGTSFDYAVNSYYPINSNVTLYPFWTKAATTKYVTVDYSDNGTVLLNGHTVPRGSKYSIEPGKSLYFTFQPNNKYYVYNLKVNGYNLGSRDDYFIVNDEKMSGDKVLYVHFGSIYGSPKTGDDSDLGLWLVLGISSAVCAAAVTVVSRRKSRG